MSFPLHRECTRGGFCNFMHLKPISRELRRELYGRRRKGWILLVRIKTFYTPPRKVVLIDLFSFLPPPLQPPQVSIPIQRPWQRSRRRWRPQPWETSFQRQRAFRTVLSPKHRSFTSPSLNPSLCCFFLVCTLPHFDLLQGSRFWWFVKLNFTSLNLKFLLKYDLLWLIFDISVADFHVCCLGLFLC